MLFVENLNTIPYRNHALEEWLMQKFNEDCFMLWRNDKAILLGKNQNLYKEVNLPYASEKGIKLVRRLRACSKSSKQDRYKSQLNHI